MADQLKAIRKLGSVRFYCTLSVNSKIASADCQIVVKIFKPTPYSHPIMERIFVKGKCQTKCGSPYPYILFPGDRSNKIAVKKYSKQVYACRGQWKFFSKRVHLHFEQFTATSQFWLLHWCVNTAYHVQQRKESPTKRTQQRISWFWGTKSNRNTWEICIYRLWCLASPIQATPIYRLREKCRPCVSTKEIPWKKKLKYVITLCTALIFRPLRRINADKFCFKRAREI